MENELAAFFKDSSALEIAGSILALVSVAVAAYTQLKVSYLTRRDHELAKKFKIETAPWMAEAEQSYLKQKYGQQIRPVDRPFPS